MIAALAADPLPVTASPVENTLLISAPELALGSRYAEVVISVNGFPLATTRIASNQWLVQTDAPYGEFSARLLGFGPETYPVTSSWLNPVEDKGFDFNIRDLFVVGAFFIMVMVFGLHMWRHNLLW